MNAAEHYAEAEFMLGQVVDAGDVDVAQGMATIAIAQVHATLALAEFTRLSLLPRPAK